MLSSYNDAERIHIYMLPLYTLAQINREVLYEAHITKLWQFYL